jgi:hypothetical protein
VNKEPERPRVEDDVQGARGRPVLLYFGQDEVAPLASAPVPVREMTLVAEVTSTATCLPAMVVIII